jgi:hypothetical protein
MPWDSRQALSQGSADNALARARDHPNLGMFRILGHFPEPPLSGPSRAAMPPHSGSRPSWNAQPMGSLPPPGPVPPCIYHTPAVNPQDAKNKERSPKRWGLL